jgi:hypothetical protein
MFTFLSDEIASLEQLSSTNEKTMSQTILINQLNSTCLNTATPKRPESRNDLIPVIPNPPPIQPVSPNKESGSLVESLLNRTESNELKNGEMEVQLKNLTRTVEKLEKIILEHQCTINKIPVKTDRDEITHMHIENNVSSSQESHNTIQQAMNVSYF